MALEAKDLAFLYFLESPPFRCALCDVDFLLRRVYVVELEADRVVRVAFFTSMLAVLVSYPRRETAGHLGGALERLGEAVAAVTLAPP